MKKILYSLLFLFIFTSGYSQVGIDEDFEGAAVPTAGVWSLTSGDWLTFDNGVGPVANWVPSSAANANQGVRAAEVLRGFNSGPIPSTSEDWLVMPRRQMRPNEQLRFFTRQGLNGNNGTLYQIRVSTNIDPYNLTAYTVFKEYTEQQLQDINLTNSATEYDEAVINMTQTGQLLYIAFVKVHTQTGASLSGDKWLIDDVQLALRCIEPTALGAEQITCSSAKIKWSNPGNASSFNVEWDFYPFDPGTGANTFTTPSGLPNTPENELTFLNANTEYAYYVQAVCGPGRTSEWFGPYFFKTKQTGALCDCPIPINSVPYSDQSNTNVYGDNITQLSPGTSGCGITGNYLAGQDVVYQFTPQQTGNVSISMNPFGVTNTGVFVYAECSNIGQNCLAGVANTNGNIRNIPLFSVTANETYYIVISSTAATFNFEYLLTIQAVTCPPPVAPALPTLSAVPSMTSAVLNWANPAGQTYTTWEHYVQLATEGLGDISGPGTSVTGTPTATVTTLQDGTTALLPGTNYQYWVRADCGNGTFSAWAGPFLFTTTQCMPENQCGYVFTLSDTGSDGWEGGRMEVRQGGIVVATLGATMTGATQNVTVQLCDDIPFELFWSVCGTSPAEVGVTVKNSFTQTLFTMASNNAPSCGTIVYQGIAECTFPECQPLVGLGLTPAPGNILTPSTASVRWTIPSWAPVGSTYDVYVVPAPFTAPSNVIPPVNNPPTSYYFANVPSSPFLITGLLQDTQYRFFVRINCPANGPSDWSTASPTITTPPLCPKVTALLVTSQTVIDTPPLATVEVKFNWTTPAAPPSNGWYVTAVPVATPANPIPPFPSAAWHEVDTALPFTYPIGLDPDTQYNYYVISDCTDNNSGYSNPAGPKLFTTPVTCPVPTGLNVVTPVTTSTTIKMYWNSPSPAGGWRVIVKPNSYVGTPPDNDAGWYTTGLTTAPTVATPYEYGLLPGQALQPNSAYKYWVQAICTGNLGDSNTAGPKTFTTIRTCFAPTSLTATGITARNAKLTWVRGSQNGVVSTETSWYVIAVPASAPVPVYPINPTVVGSTGWINVTTLPTVGSEYTFPGGQFGTGYPDGPLIPDTDYKYYVVADCGENNFINIMVSNPVVTEGQDATFTVSLSSPSAVNTVIEFTTNPVSATTADYTPTTIQVTIPAGQLSATVTVPTLTDAIAETSETFVLDGVVTSGNTISSAPQGIATIYDALDVDSDPYVYVSNVTVQEGQTATFTVGLTAASTEPTVINLTLANGTANAADYTAPLVLPIAVTIPAGQLTATVTIPTIYDALVEANETFSLVAAVQSENTSNTAATGICTILDGIQGPAKAFHTLPSCIKPATTTVVANSETPYTVNIWWTNGVGSTATTWQILYVPTGTDITGLPPQETYSGPIPTATTPYTVGQAPNTPLTPDTTYDIYVRGDCGTYDGVSLWTGPKTFTTDPTCFPPTALTWINDNANPATLTWAVNAQQPTTTNWEFSYLPYTGNVNNPLSGTIIPVTGLTYTTPTGPGALAPGFYEFYVRAVCSDSDKSKWSGPVIFSIFADPVICAAINLDLETGVDEVDVCIEDNCTELTANFNDLGDTTNYNVLPIEFTTPFPITDGTNLNISTDDLWSPAVPLQFNFCFFGEFSEQVWVGSNGVITFTNPNGTFCEWDLDGLNIPNTAFPIRNAVYGPYQDINPAPGANPSPHHIKYGVVGTAPCRAFVVNYYHIAQFSCNENVGLQTSQIVLYETSNIIEVYVQNRTQCLTWPFNNGGQGVIGIQNSAGTQAFVPPGKNTLDNWSAQNEAFRFTPAGASIVEFEWQDAAGNPISNSTTLEVCPTTTTVYTASATYTNCGVDPVTVTQDVTVNVNEITVTDMPDVNVCGEYILPSLTTGKYFTEEDGTGIELLPGAVITETATIYIFDESGTIPNCTDQEDFTVTINPIPLEPASGGDQEECAETPIQTLTAEATAPAGSNVVWYDAPIGGNIVLDPSLSQVDEVTYYAESIYTVAGCKSATRTPVTLEITATPTDPTITNGGVIKECAESPIQTLTAVVNPEPGINVRWFSDAAGTIIVTNPTLSSVGTQEYWAQSYNPITLCKSIGLTKVTLIIDDVPDFSLTGGCENGKYTINVNPITDFTTSTPTFEWTDSLGQVVSTSSSFQPTKTDTYYCEVTVNGCSSIEPFNATNIACDIQKGISPKGMGGDGDNDFFDLTTLNVTKLEIFNRYGSKVYTKDNYEKEWFGQSDKGDELPDGTYYYVIELLDEPSKTGWIYINREQ